MTEPVVACPHCGMRVFATADQVCPACGKSTQPLSADAVDAVVEEQDAHSWDRYQRLLDPNPLQTVVGKLTEQEKEFLPIRQELAKSVFHSIPETLDRIRRELIPSFEAAIDKVRATTFEETGERVATGLLQYLSIRLASWNSLVQAYQNRDDAALRTHLQRWEESEVLAIALRGQSQPLRIPSAEERNEQFIQALASFTPVVVVTPAIVVINVVIFVAMLIASQQIQPNVATVLAWGGNFGPLTLNGQWWRLFTCMFLHFGVLHVGLNMLVLWNIGRLVERLVSNTGFLIVYLITGLAGSIASLFWNQTVVSAGASGAVFGVAGALLGFIVLRKDTVPIEVLKQLRNSLVAFVGYNIFFGLIVPGIDNAAHMGGLVAGLLCGLFLSQPIAPEMVTRRVWKNSLLAVIGPALLFGLTFGLPGPPVDISGELQKLGEEEQKLLELDNDLIRQAQQGLLSDSDHADRVEQELLAPWRRLLGRVKSLREEPLADKDYFDRVIHYMRCRETAWRFRVEALREQDPDKMQLANEKTMEADTLARDLAKPSS